MMLESFGITLPMDCTSGPVRFAWELGLGVSVRRGHMQVHTHTFDIHLICFASLMRSCNLCIMIFLHRADTEAVARRLIGNSRRRRVDKLCDFTPSFSSTPNYS